MEWAIKRDETGMPVSMHWLGPSYPKLPAHQCKAGFSTRNGKRYRCRFGEKHKGEHDYDREPL